MVEPSTHTDGLGERRRRREAERAALAAEEQRTLTRRELRRRQLEEEQARLEAHATGELHLRAPDAPRPASPASPTGDSPAAVPTAQSGSAVPTGYSAAMAPTAQSSSAAPSSQTPPQAPTAYSASAVPSAFSAAMAPTAQSASAVPSAYSAAMAPTAQSASAVPSAYSGAMASTAQTPAAAPSAMSASPAGGISRRSMRARTAPEAPEAPEQGDGQQRAPERGARRPAGPQQPAAPRPQAAPDRPDAPERQAAPDRPAPQQDATALRPAPQQMSARTATTRRPVVRTPSMAQGIRTLEPSGKISAVQPARQDHGRVSTAQAVAAASEASRNPAAWESALNLPPVATEQALDPLRVETAVAEPLPPLDDEDDIDFFTPARPRWAAVSSAASPASAGGWSATAPEGVAERRPHSAPEEVAAPKRRPAREQLAPSATASVAVASPAAAQDDWDEDDWDEDDWDDEEPRNPAVAAVKYLLLIVAGVVIGVLVAILAFSDIGRPSAAALVELRTQVTAFVAPPNG